MPLFIRQLLGQTGQVGVEIVNVFLARPPVDSGQRFLAARAGIDVEAGHATLYFL
jgi:hypothetical protein